MLTGYIMLVRYSSFDFFFVLLTVSNCALLLVMKRSSQYVDVSVAKRAVSKRVGLARSWAATVFRQSIGAMGKASRATVESHAVHMGSLIREVEEREREAFMAKRDRDEVQVEATVTDDYPQDNDNRDDQTNPSNDISIAAAIKACHYHNGRSPSTQLHDISEAPSPTRLTFQPDDLNGFGPPTETGTTPLLSNLSAITATTAVKRRRFFGKAKPLSASTLSIVPSTTTTDIHDLGLALTTATTVT